MTEISPLLQELDEEIKKGNYIRAEALSKTLKRPENEIKELRKKAFKQFILEFRNYQGAYEIAKEFNFSKEDIDKFIDEAIKEAEEKKILERRQFDTKTMKYLSLREWIREYFKK